MKSNLRITIFSMIVTVAIAVSGIKAEAQGGPASSESGTVTLDNLNPIPETNTGTQESQQTSQPNYYNDSPGYTSPGIAVIPGGVGSSQVSPFGPWINFEGQFGTGLGWDQNNYYIKSFFPKHIEPGKSLIFGILNGNVTDESGGGLNAGVGYRKYSYSHNRIFGASLIFDLDNGYEKSHKQVGLSLESIGKYVTMRFNHYENIDDDSEVLSSGRISDDLVFFGNYLGFEHLSIVERQYNNSEFLIGGPLPLLGSKGFEGYLGAYYLNNSDADNAAGFKFTVNANATENMKVGVTFSNDKVFGTNTYVNVSYLFPHKHPARWFKPQKVREQLQAPVQRENRIAVNTESVISTEALINPADGMPFYVSHTDPNLPTGTGDGTFEDPYGDLETARLANMPFIDIHRVIPRDDASGTDLVVTAPFRLFDDQRMLGTSFEHMITGTQGTFVFPGFTGSGPGPLVSSTGGDAVVHLADRNEVNGFIIDGSSGARDGISQPFGTVVDSFTLVNNTFQSVLDGIDLTNPEGTGLISFSTFASSLRDGYRSLRDTPGAPLALTIADSTFTSAGEHGIHYGASLGTDTLTFERNTFVSNVAGDILIDLSGSADVGSTVADNTFDAGVGGVRSPGLIINTSGASTSTSLITGNTFSNNSDAIQINADGSSHSTFGIGLNTIDDNDDSGIDVAASGTATIDMAVAFNSITRNATTLGEAGIKVTTNGSSLVRGSITDNIISEQVNGMGVYLLGNNTSTIDFGSIAGREVARNTIDGNAVAGFTKYLNDSSRGYLDFNNNTVTGTRNATGPAPEFIGNAVHVRLEESSILHTAQFVSNILGGSGNSNEGNGLFFETFSNSRAPDIDILMNDMSFNGVNGFRFERGGNSFVDDAVVDNNTFNNNGVDGMWLFAEGSNVDLTTLANFTMDFLVTNNVASDNGSDGFHFQTAADVDLVVTMDMNTADNNGFMGVYTDIAGNSSISGVWSNLTVTNSAIDGLFFDVGLNQGGTGATITIVDSIIDNNKRDGLHYLGRAGGSSVITFVRNMVTNNTGDGIEIEMVDTIDPSTFQNNSTITFHSMDNVIARNGQAGIEIVAGKDVFPQDTDGGEQSSFVFNSLRDFIERNGGDGISSLTRELTTGTLNVIDATIQFNGERGIDVVNMDDAFMTLQVAGTVDPRASSGLDATSNIRLNALQGIYIENNANRTDPGVNHVDYYTANNMNILIHQNAIESNGIGGSTFADDLIGLFLRVGTSTNGLTQAAITQNYFSGNNGVDFAVESFVANRDPVVIDPAWTDGNFGPGSAGHEFDPVARLNLRFRNNVAQQVDVTRPGAYFFNADAFKSPPVFFGARSNRTRSAQQFPRASIIVGGGSVLDPPAPSEGAFDSTAVGTDDEYVNSVLRFTTGGLTGTSRQITGFTAATGSFSFISDFAAIPFLGDNFVLETLNVAFNGHQSDSSFITEDASLAAGGNVIAPGGIISDFGTVITIPNLANDPIDFVSFGWDTTGAFPVIFP